jgi:hypothetical protein
VIRAALSITRRAASAAFGIRASSGVVGTAGAGQPAAVLCSSCCDPALSSRPIAAQRLSGARATLAVTAVVGFAGARGSPGIGLLRNEVSFGIVEQGVAALRTQHGKRRE